MKSFKTITLIGIMIFSIMLLWSCKKNDTVEPPVDNTKTVTVTGEVSNNTTGSTDTAEINDDIHVTATVIAHADSPGLDTALVGIYEGDKRISYVTLNGSLEPGSNIIMYTLNMSGDEILASENAFAGKTIDIKVEYRLSGTSEMSYTKIGEMTIIAEKDYSWGTEKNQHIYDNREAIAEILDRNALFHGKKMSLDNIKKTLDVWYDSSNLPNAQKTELQDTFPGNNFKMTSNNTATFDHLTEKDLYDILQIIGE